MLLNDQLGQGGIGGLAVGVDGRGGEGRVDVLDPRASDLMQFRTGPAHDAPDDERRGHRASTSRQCAIGHGPRSEGRHQRG